MDHTCGYNKVNVIHEDVLPNGSMGLVTELLTSFLSRLNKRSMVYSNGTGHHMLSTRTSCGLYH